MVESNALGIFFNAYSHVGNILKRIFAHQLLNPKVIGACSGKSYRGYQYAMFIDIIHSAAQPSFIVCSKAQIESLLLHAIARNLGIKINPNVIVPISVGMPDHYIEIVFR